MWGSKCDILGVRCGAHMGWGVGATCGIFVVTCWGGGYDIKGIRGEHWGIFTRYILYIRVTYVELGVTYRV